MKRILTVIAAVLFSVVALQARPGYTKPVDVYQPDGSTVTLLMHGDEFHSFITTADGYTVVKGDDGYYCYAAKTAAGMLEATAMVAHNSDVRTADEMAFLASQKKMVRPEMTAEQKKRKAMAAKLYAPMQKADPAGPHKTVSIWSRINYDNFKGLVVLVNFSDRQFTMNDPVAFYQKLTSQANYTDDTKTYYPENVEGSARDYFRANSNGIFDPTFDVVGPITISRTAASVGGQSVTASTLASIFKSALNQINSTVDFSQYDLDGNGYIDMVYFIFAGYGSYVQGNNTGYIWPHANDWTGYSSYAGMPAYDGKRFGRYACSVEIQDYEGYADLPGHPWLDGIGTICHEFSHVLGLADHYDTDDEANGYSDGTGVWDVMAAGADYNYGLTPVGYNAFERHILGFCEPAQLTLAGKYSLSEFGTGNSAYILKTGSTDDDFYIENRQNVGWDRFLPGHGLFAWRADTSTPTVWKNNTVNNNASHQYFEMVCNTSGNPIDLTSTTTPALKSWAGKPAVLDLFDIAEDEGVISFTAGKNLYQSVVEDFEAMALTGDATGVNGVFSKWDLSGTAVVNVAEAGFGNGQHVLKFNRSGSITSSQAFTKGIRTMKFTVNNGGYQIRFGLKVSTDGGNTWEYFEPEATMKKNASQTFEFFSIPAGAQIQFLMRSTSTAAVCYVDDIECTFVDNDIPSAITAVKMDGKTSTTGIYNLAGQRVKDNYRGIVIVDGKKAVRK